MRKDTFKKLVAVFFLTSAFLFVLYSFVALTVGAAGVPVTDHIEVTSYQEGTDYMAEMYKCAQDGSHYALQMGYIYETQRNLKLEENGLVERKTSYFSSYNNGEDILTAIKASRLKEEHWYAGFVYEYLSMIGYSDAVAAGIIGNMMNECGGNTLDLQPHIYGFGGYYYGLCMWNLSYANIGGWNILNQLGYLSNTIEKHMTSFGGNYEYFKSITDPGAAARYFNTYYERGAGGATRARNAHSAYQWITKGEASTM